MLVIQSCATLCDPMDYSLSGSSVHGTFQERRLEWVAISSSGDYINVNILLERRLNGVAALKDISGLRAGADGDDAFRFRNLCQRADQTLLGLRCDRSGHDDNVSMPR